MEGRTSERVHLIDDEYVTFVSVRADSDEEAIERAYDEVMEIGPDWERTDIVHEEGEIRIVRLSRDKKTLIEERERPDHVE